MLVDVTTHNSVYDALSPQAQWFDHRIGRRNYPTVELTLSQIQQLHDNDAHLFHMVSVYGDVADWSHLTDYLIEHPEKPLYIDTYGMFTKDALLLLRDANLHRMVIKIDGWGESMGKIHLGQKHEVVMNTIREVSKNHHVFVEYYTYKHNVKDIKCFLEFCESMHIHAKLTTGDMNDDGLSCIVDQDGQWLYDVYSAGISSDWIRSKHTKNITYDAVVDDEILHKSVTGFNRLRTFIQPPQGRSILNNPILPSLSALTNDTIISKFTSRSQTKSCTVTGHVFDNNDLGMLFSMLLGDDWKVTFNDVSTKDQYRLEALYAIKLLAEMDLDLIKTQF